MTPTATTSTSQRLSEPARVVICDDSAALRHLYRLLFQVDGDLQVVGEAGDGAQVVTVARDTKPDVVLLDIAMPVRDGLDAIPDLRAASPNSAIVMCTAMSGDAIRRRALELGAVNYIEKGVEPNVIVDAVREAARTSRRSA